MPRAPSPRSRRSTEEVRERLLEAARELFVANGYESTYTKAICERAGVAEKVLFANFASKAGIFDAAFIEPFSALADRYVAAWDDDAGETAIEQRIGSFISGLYELVHRNRTVLRAALTRQAVNGADAHSQIVQHLALTIESILRVEPDALGGVDQHAALHAVAGMVFGVVLLDDLLTPAGRRRPGRARLEREMTNMVLHGVLDRPGPGRIGS